MTNVSIKLDLEAAALMLVVTMTNDGNIPVRSRVFYPPYDLHIANAGGEAAMFYLSPPYGYDKSGIVLAPGEASAVAFDLRRDFLFPTTGEYSACAHFVMRRTKAAALANAGTQAGVESNSIAFVVTDKSDDWRFFDGTL
ncbi:MAG: hypothetical protein WBD20_13005 [Pirellulaceae bacterium]